MKLFGCKNNVFRIIAAVFCILLTAAAVTAIVMLSNTVIEQNARIQSLISESENKTKAAGETDEQLSLMQRRLGEYESDISGLQFLLGESEKENEALRAEIDGLRSEYELFAPSEYNVSVILTDDAGESLDLPVAGIIWDDFSCRWTVAVSVGISDPD